MTETARVAVDALIVGLGPAGASAAYHGARRGLNILAVDKKATVGQPVQCAEYIPQTIAGHSAGEGVRQQAVTLMQSRLPSGEIETPAPGFMVDRAAFDQALAARAEAAGARLSCTTRLLDLNTENGYARLIESGKTIEVAYGALIAADGPRSRVARLLGLPPLPVVYSYQSTLPLLSTMEETRVWLDGRFPGGYGWLFPRGTEANLGAAGLASQAVRIKEGLRALQRELQSEGLLGEGRRRETGGPIPVGGLRQPLIRDGVIFAGDAAGLCHPITGAGIAMALDSGEVAAAAVADYLAGEGDALDEYAEEIDARYGPSLRHAVERRECLQGLWDSGEYVDESGLRATWVAFAEYFEALS